MKRLFAMLLVIAMVFALCACGGSDEKKPVDNAGVEDMGGDNIESDVPPVTNEDGVDMTLMERMEKILGQELDLDQYDISYLDSEMAILYLKDGGEVELDFAVNLDDGSTIQLPVRYGDLLNAGWTSSANWEDSAAGGTMGSAMHTNASGDTVHLSIVNPTDETLPLADIWVNSITVGDVFTAGFDIEGITLGSSVSDIISVWGNPYSISFFITDDYMDLELIIEDAEGTLSLQIDSETSLVSAAVYRYDSANLQ